jgi:drug/metabolite transporter (DMT)-like permease
VLYLVTFGSIVGYTSYVYALKKLPVAIVATHTYVNPLVAAALGWFFYREPFGIRETLAMLVIFAGVAVVKRYGSRPVDPGSPLRPATPSRELSPPSPRPASAAE